MIIPQWAVDTVCRFEGFRSHPYRDPVGIWTIGYGSTRDARGQPITPQTPMVTMEQAKALVARDLGDSLKAVFELVRVDITVAQEAALIDFVYNLGAGALRVSTLLKLLNQGDYEGAAKQFPRWDHAGGKVLPGLLRRREAEEAEFELAT